jgi:hypothetical protein
VLRLTGKLRIKMKGLGIVGKRTEQQVICFSNGAMGLVLKHHTHFQFFEVLARHCETAKDSDFLISAHCSGNIPWHPLNSLTKLGRGIARNEEHQAATVDRQE